MSDQILSWLVLVVPVILGLLVILVPAKHEDEKSHMRWRYVLGSSLILYGGMAWIQQTRATSASVADREQAIRDTASQTSAQVSKTVGQQYEQMISDLTMQIQSLKDQLSVQSKTFTDQLKQTGTDINGNISKVGITPVKYAELHFGFFSDTMPLPTVTSLDSNSDNTVSVNFSVTNISDTQATTAELWVRLCDECSFVKEPQGFDRPAGTGEKVRHKMFSELNPGVSLEKMTIDMKMTKSFSFAVIGFTYSCATCGKLAPQQTLRINFIRPLVLQP